MARVEKLPQYRTNLDDIWFFIAQDSVANADRFIDRIEETVSRIAQNPMMGRSAESLGAGLRQFPIGKYLFFYRPLSDGIQAVAIVSGYRDLEHLFDDD